MRYILVDSPWADKSKKIDTLRVLCFYPQVLQILSLRIFVLVTLALLIIFTSAVFKSDAALLSDTIRVAILKNAASVTVEGEGLLATRENGTPVLLTAPVVIKPVKDGIMAEGESYRRLIFASAALVTINGKAYRGTAEIHPGEKGLLVVNELQLEDYLAGLINSEISSAWPIESVKAQAVIARTYALNRKQARKQALYHLESTVMDQVYEGSRIEDSRATRAVAETAGEVLTYGDAIIQAFYHSSCGGKTEASENVWGAALPYLKGVDCKYCLTTPSSSWSLKISLREVEERLRSAGFRVADISDIKAGNMNNRGRLANIAVISQRGTLLIPGDQFRKAIGYGVLKSTNLSIRIANGEVEFNGSGNGHGVGLCQWGAKQRALDGFSYQEILSYYYPGTVLKKQYETFFAGR